MPFGFTNAPTTFYTLMNHMFHDYLDKFMVVYLDDMVVYNSTLEEHNEACEDGVQKIKNPLALSEKG